MAKPAIPSPLDRRHLVEKDLDEKTALKIAAAYLEQGRRNEAIDFLAKANDTAQLKALADEAISLGDPFLLQSVTQATGEEPDRASWNRCADAAEAAGKSRYAVTARRNAARSEI
ncbi:MAG: hypothetical protein JRG94_06010 [Deltaproteobacteria bacterium]|nr:hypothetical protein [Deltaproteobacteria bacterium]